MKNRQRHTRVFYVVLLAMFTLTMQSRAASDRAPACQYTADAVKDKTNIQAQKLMAEMASFASNSLPLYRLLMILDELTPTDKAVLSCVATSYFPPLEALSNDALTQLTEKTEFVDMHFRLGPEHLLSALDRGVVLPTENYALFSDQRMSLIGYLLLRNHGKLELALAQQLEARGVDVVPLDLFYTGFGSMDNHDVVIWLFEQLSSDDYQFMWTEPGEHDLPWSLLAKVAVFGDVQTLEWMLDHRVGDKQYALYLLLTRLMDDKKLTDSTKHDVISKLRVFYQYGASVSVSTWKKVKKILNDAQMHTLIDDDHAKDDLLSTEESAFFNLIVNTQKKTS